MKMKILAAAVGAGVMMMGSAAMAQTIDGTPCEAVPNGGLGAQTCKLPDATRAEGVLWTAAEQAVSIVSAIADSRGCFSSGNTPIPLTIQVDYAFNPLAPDVHFVGTSKLGGTGEQFTYLTKERAYDPTQQQGLRRIDTSADDAAAANLVNKVLGAKLSELTGAFYADGKYSIMQGGADFRHGAAELDEHLIKDFYEGIAVKPTFKAGPGGACVLQANGFPTEQDFLDKKCVVDDAGDYNPLDPLEAVRVIRDNGLEVTTKKHIVEDLQTTVQGGNLIEVGAPKGKWRQTSFYREPDGAGNGRLVYTKVRIAPFGAPVCALQLAGTVKNTVDNPDFTGTITLFPLGVAPGQ
jgi:hypothetical protein